MHAYAGFTVSSLGCAFQLFTSCRDVESARTLAVCWYSTGRNNGLVWRTHILCVLFFMATAVDAAPWSLSAPHPRRGGLRFGRTRSFRAELAVPRGRSRRFKAVNGGGAPDTLGAPAVAKRTKPNTSVLYTLNRTKQCRFWRPCGTLYALRILFYRAFSWTEHRSRQAFLLGFSM